MKVLSRIQSHLRSSHVICRDTDGKYHYKNVHQAWGKIKIDATEEKTEHHLDGDSSGTNAVG
jgi:hypothetical protein